MPEIAQGRCPGCLRPRHPDKVLVVYRPQDLQALIRRSAQFDGLVFPYPLASRTNLDEFGSTLLRLHQECGCFAGQVALIAALPLVAGWLIWNWWAADERWNYAWAVAVGGILLSILVSKWATVAWAQLRLRALVHRTISEEERTIRFRSPSHCRKAAEQ